MVALSMKILMFVLFAVVVLPIVIVALLPLLELGMGMWADLLGRW